jgi:hypothetical protein
VQFAFPHRDFNLPEESLSRYIGAVKKPRAREERKIASLNYFLVFSRMVIPSPLGKRAIPGGETGYFVSH